MHVARILGDPNHELATKVKAKYPDQYEAQQKSLAAKVVQLRFHLGIGVDETARALDTSPRTVKRRWAFARTWLYRELLAGGDAGSEDESSAPR